MKLVSDSEQKIFPVKRPWCELAYAAAGIAALPKDDTCDTPILDFRSALADAIATLAAKPFDQFALLIDRLSRRINTQLRSLHAITGGFPQQDAKGTIMYLVFVGYYHKSAVIGTVRFFQDSGRVRVPEVNAYRPSGTSLVISMPHRIGEILKEQSDARLAGFYTANVKKLFSHEPLSLDEARDAATKCIAACTDPIALEIDPTAHTVGGHVHLATITESAGLKWIVPPTSSA